MKEDASIWSSLEALCWAMGFNYADYESFWEGDNPPKHSKLSVRSYLKFCEALDIDYEDFSNS